MSVVTGLHKQKKGEPFGSPLSEFGLFRLLLFPSAEEIVYIVHIVVGTDFLHFADDSSTAPTRRFAVEHALADDDGGALPCPVVFVSSCHSSIGLFLYAKISKKIEICKKKMYNFFGNFLGFLPNFFMLVQ